MKRFLFNSFFLFCALLMCALMFTMKYKVLDKEGTLTQLHREIVQNQRAIHVLKAEWAHLNDPERLRRLIDKQTTLSVVKSGQIIRLEDIPLRVAQPPAHKPPITEGESDV